MKGRSKEYLLALRRKYRLGEFRCGPSTSKAKKKPVRKPPTREPSIWD